MTLVGNILVSVLAFGVWVLIAVTLTSSSAQAEGQGLSRSEVQPILEDCKVRGEAERDETIYVRIRR